MLNKSTIDILSKDMSIEVEEITSKLLESNLRQYKNEILNIIDQYASAVGALAAEEKINEIYFQNKHLHTNLDVHEIIDSMRHAFISFSEGGLLDLFTYQENEGWYPKIILRKELCPNDKHTLPNPANVFRGCSKYEYEMMEFGQSWTTSLEIARLFAFSHYHGQPWFKFNDSVVVKAKIEKNGILYSKQFGESEIVVKQSYLKDIENIT